MRPEPRAVRHRLACTIWRGLPLRRVVLRMPGMSSLWVLDEPPSPLRASLMARATPLWRAADSFSPGPHPVVGHPRGFWRGANTLPSTWDMRVPRSTGERLRDVEPEYRRIGHEGGGFPGTLRMSRSAARTICVVLRAHLLTCLVLSFTDTPRRSPALWLGRGTGCLGVACVVAAIRCGLAGGGAGGRVPSAACVRVGD